MTEQPRLTGMVPDTLRVRQQRILFDRIEVSADIGFHAFEIGAPQRLLISIELWLEDHRPPAADDPALAWDYDHVVQIVRALAGERRYNLQETLVHAIFDRIAGMRGIAALRVTSAKPDIYPDAHGVGVEISSFAGDLPERQRV